MRRVFAVWLLLTVCSWPAFAQVTSSTGAITGTVTDNSTASVPGVTVKIESPQMIGGLREAVTDTDGRYQFAALTPGTYKITFDLPGFARIVREGVVLSAGFTANINAEMQVATQQETITVTGASPVVDVKSTNIKNNFDVETMKNLPTARDFPALMAETPGVTMTRVDVGGSAAMSETNWRVYGTSAGGNQYTVEGIQVDSNYYNDFGSFSEVQIETAAHTAEMAVPGVMSNMIAKSGGNTYHGDFYTDYERLGFSTRNIDDDQLKLGVTGGSGLDARDTNRIDKYQDVNGSAGGFIIKDRLWWFGSLRYNESLVRYTNFPVKPQLTRVTSRSAKATYNLSKNNKVIGYYNHNFKYQPERFVSKTELHYSLDEPWDEDFPVGSWKVEYNSVISPAMFLEARYGDFLYDFYNYDRAPDKVLRRDTSTQERFGGTAANLRHLRRPQSNGAFNYFKSGWLGESHNIKIGWEIAQFNLNQQYDTYGRVGRSGTAVQPDIELRYANGSPTQVIFTESPSSANVFQRTYSAYINDAWQLTSRVSMNVGFRFDRYRGGYPDQVHNALRYNPVTRTFEPSTETFAGNPDSYHFNAPGPRAGIVWDVDGKGQTVVKLNYGQYPWRATGRGVPGQNPNAETWTRTYAWTDPSRDNMWQAGEEGRLLSSAGGAQTQFIDPNWKNNVTREWATWVERELAPNFGVRSGIVWRTDKYKQVTYDPRRPLSAYNVPRQVRDPGPDGVLNNADDGALLTVYDLDPAVLGATTPVINVTTNNPFTDGDSHTTWEISGVKRMTNHWSMNTSFSMTWSREVPSPNSVVDSTIAVAAFGTRPGDFVGTESDGKRHYKNWNGKIAGTLQLGHDIRLSPVLRTQSGDPFGRTIQVTMNYGQQPIQVESESSRRVHNITLLDFRAEKGFRARGMRVSAFLDVFNIANTNAEQDIVQIAGSTFLRPVVIVGPRIARIGAKFEF
jgi:hypothetical protein